MFRRSFIQLAAVGASAAHTSKTVKYRIVGFTCVTCAVGLDSMLRDQKGILHSKSSYPDRSAIIDFDPDSIKEAEIKAFIQELGFRVQE